jgi:uncharacterized RDD family membrane protein YckC
MDETVAQLVGDATKRRLFAAGVDNLLAMFVALFITSRLPGSSDKNLAMGLAVVVYLSYFLGQEATWSNTIGKRLFGLRLCRLNGESCGGWEASVRTLTRIVEVNPLLLGGLPAAIVGVTSKRHQRLGDMLGGCVVIPASEVEHIHAAVQQSDASDEVRAAQSERGPRS